MTRSIARGLVVLACMLALCARAEAGFLVIRNAKNPTAKLSRDGVKGVFSGKTKQWPGGELVRLVIGQEDSPAMQWLASAICGVPVKTFLTKIKQDVFKGDIPRPFTASDDAGTIQRVQSGPGVVGVISDAAAKSLPADVLSVSLE